MSLVVENGTGLSNAESLVSVAEADTYHANRGNTAWALLTEATKEQMLRKANDYLGQAYRSRWKGYRRLSTQACDWPRYDVSIDGGNFVSAAIVPNDVKNAAADLALRASTETLNPNLTQRVKSETVGAIKVEYDEFSSQAPVFTAVETLLSPYLKSSPISVSLVK